MKIKSAIIFVVIFSLFSIVSFAEPSNLALLKQELKIYHDSGIYQQEFKKIVQLAHHFVLNRVKQNTEVKKPEKLAVILDIDETSISNYPHMVARDFSDNRKVIHQKIQAADAPVLKPMLDLYQELHKNGISVFFVTGRHESEKMATIKNLIKAGYHHWSGLYFKPPHYKESSAIPFKTQARANIAKQGYTIIASIGDQESDLKGGFAEKTFKLPNPYYFIP